MEGVYRNEDGNKILNRAVYILLQISYREILASTGRLKVCRGVSLKLNDINKQKEQGPGSAWIGIKLSCWIRIRIQEGKKDSQK
jgi:hypothetical protein